jgi:hypothetical protein
MYIFDPRRGILSIVEYNKTPAMLLVRAPARADIEHYWPHARIIETPRGDYLQEIIGSAV